MQHNDIPIHSPQRGGRISIDWADKVTRAINARRLIAGVGIRLTKNPNGIMIESTARGGGTVVHSSATSPFTCRYAHHEETGSYDGWEIYLPQGCVSIGKVYIPLNPKAKRKDPDTNEIKEEADWYRLGLIDSDDTKNVTQKPNENVIKDALSVCICCKKYAALKDVDGFSDIPKCYFWAEAKSTNMVQADKDKYTAEIGDVLTIIVGTIIVTKKQGSSDEPNDGGFIREYEQSRRDTIIVSDYSPADGMDLLYSFDRAQNHVQLTVDKVYMVNKIFNAAGVTFVGNKIDELDVGITNGKIDDATVYLKIDTTQNQPVGKILVNKSSGNNDQNQDSDDDSEITEDDFIKENKSFGDIMVMLYKIKDGYVIQDNRKALHNIQMYMQ